MNIKQDFKNITDWIFDLDDTLYPPTEEIFSQMSTRIRSYIIDLLGVDQQSALELQESYYRKYGATVRGLILEHQIAPETFTDYVHDLDLSSLSENKGLKRCLESLNGKKFIFTNGAFEHAERVMKKIGISDCFEGIFSIREADYIPKPSEETYHKMIDIFKININQAVMFDDSQVNLLTAHNVGLKTVWISGNERDNRFNMISKTPTFCTYQTHDLVGFLNKVIG